MILSSDTITNIAKDFSQFKEAKRAKKLVFYISQRYWENDQSIIDSYSWEDLLANLYDNNPTVDDLKALLSHAVNSLNRKEIYLKIAKYILKRMTPLYQNQGDSYNTQNQDESRELENDIIERIVENIIYHDEAIRMKKLIFAVCKQYWENDINVIDMYDFRDVILEIRQLYPTTRRLRKALDSVVATINRQNFYSFIADTIVGELTYLYNRYEPVNTEQNEEEDQEETMLILSEKAKSKQKEKSAKVSKEDKETKIEEELPSKSEMLTSPVDTNIPEGQVIPWLKLDNLFDLKQEIMQYTNPLRAKIMLFYAIYQIDIREQHWSIVRTCSIDDLLIKVFQHYDKNVDAVEADMMAIANSRIEGLEPEDNIQAVSAIIECIKRFHKKP
jgi:hypothetical protein